MGNKRNKLPLREMLKMREDTQVIILHPTMRQKRKRGRPITKPSEMRPYACSKCGKAYYCAEKCLHCLVKPLCQDCGGNP